MDVCETEGVELGENMAELGIRIFHAHSLERVEGGEADGCAVSADCFDNSLDDFKGEPGTIFNGAAVAICSLVRHILEELIDKISVCTVDLDAIETSCDCVLRSLNMGRQSALEYPRCSFLWRGHVYHRLE